MEAPAGPSEEIRLRLPWPRLPAPIFLLFALTLGLSMARDLPHPGVLFWMALALALGYAGVAFLFNHTRIELGRGALTANSRPLPWIRVRVAADDLSGFRIDTNTGDGEAMDWNLVVVLRSGGSRRLHRSHDHAALESARRTLSSAAGLQ
ncbi:MAG: hypothetical protein HY293_02035 [Planctomycetes bacterium]|nr:hypothetical protein [Planctomycetota bacterium]